VSIHFLIFLSEVTFFGEKRLFTPGTNQTTTGSWGARDGCGRRISLGGAGWRGSRGGGGSGRL